MTAPITWFLPGYIRHKKTLQYALEAYGLKESPYWLFDQISNNPFDGDVEVWDSSGEIHGDPYLGSSLPSPKHLGISLSSSLASASSVNHPRLKEIMTYYSHEGSFAFVTSVPFAKALRKAYPSLKLIFSPLGSLIDRVPELLPVDMKAYYKEKEELFDLIQVPQHITLEPKSLKILNPKRVIIPLNDRCILHCDRRDHHSLISDHNSRGERDHQGHLNRCHRRESGRPLGFVYFSCPDHFMNLLGLGFNKFSLQSRLYSGVELEMDLLKAFHWSFIWEKLRGEKPS